MISLVHTRGMIEYVQQLAFPLFSVCRKIPFLSTHLYKDSNNSNENKN